MPAPRLTPHRLRLALLDRQLLLQRSAHPVPAVLEQVAGLQAQYAPSGYVGLWSRVAGFARDDLTRALEDRSVVQGTLMRTTIHLVSARDFWPFALGVRRARRDWWLRLHRDRDEDDGTAEVDWLRAALSDGPRDVRELGPGAAGFVGHLGLWVDLVRVPPSGTWERRRADRIALAEQWLGGPDVTELEGRRHLVRAYLRGFGPAAWADIASWAGVPVTALRTAAEGLDLVRFRDEAGRALVDLAGLAIPDPEAPAPVRFLGHWDATLLVHARRTELLPEAHRGRVFSDRNPFSVGAILIDGQVAGTWSVRDRSIEVEPFDAWPPHARSALEAELEGLRAFHR